AISQGGVLVDANPQLAAMFGYELNEMLGRPVLDFVASRSQDLVAEHVRKGDETPYEAFHARKDGSEFLAGIHARMMMRDGGRVRVTVMRDITEQKHAETALRDTMEKLEARVRERTADLVAANTALRESEKWLQSRSQRLVELQEDERRRI